MISYRRADLQDQINQDKQISPGDKVRLNAIGLEFVPHSKAFYIDPSTIGTVIDVGPANTQVKFVHPSGSMQNFYPNEGLEKV